MPRKFDAMDFLTQPSRKSTFWYFWTMIHLPFIPWYTETKSSLVACLSPMEMVRRRGLCQSSY